MGGGTGLEGQVRRASVHRSSGLSHIEFFSAAG